MYYLRYAMSYSILLDYDLNYSLNVIYMSAIKNGFKITAMLLERMSVSKFHSGSFDILNFNCHLWPILKML